MTGRAGNVTERTSLSLADFEAEMIRLEAESETINMLVYGDSNAGKTVLAGTTPGRTFWLIGEPGYKSAARQGATGHGRRIGNTAEALAAVDWLQAKGRATKLDWLIVDGATTMQDRFRLAYTAEAFDTKGSRTHRNLPDKPDYFNTQNFLKSWIPQLIDLPCNLLITAHAYRTEGEDGELIGFPGFQGKGTEIANAISGLMDVTAYLESRKVKHPTSNQYRTRRRLWFESPSGRSKQEADVRYIAGDKFACLGSHMDNPTMPRIISKINGESENENA